MQNIFEFLYRFRVFLLFLLLQGISIVLLVRNFSYHHSLFFNSANTVTGTFYQTVSSVKEYFLLDEINDKLQEENIRLRERLRDSKYSDYTKKDTFSDTLLKQKYFYIEAEVIRSSVSNINNYITLNKGSLHGIHPGMGVIASDGVAGEVIQVSENFSLVQSILNTNTRIPPKIEETDNYGTLTWDGKNPGYAILNLINIQAKVRVGQKVVTSNNSSIYPENIPIGIISEVSTPPGANFYDIRVKLNTDFGKIRKVTVVENLLKDEQDSLERAVQEVPKP